jgi:hypothetical protein
MNNISITVNAESAEALKAQLRQILEGEAAKPAAALTPKGLDATEAARLPAGEPTAAATSDVAAPKTRKKADKPAEPKAEVKPEPEVKTDPPAEVPSLDDVRGALMNLSKAEGHGSEAVFELLGAFGAKNASTVPEDKRAALIAAVTAKMA